MQIPKDNNMAISTQNSNVMAFKGPDPKGITVGWKLLGTVKKVRILEGLD